ncbi:unnamed protein product, partial [Effrenium voratum]
KSEADSQDFQKCLKVRGASDAAKIQIWRGAAVHFQGNAQKVILSPNRRFVITSDAYEQDGVTMPASQRGICLVFRIRGAGWRLVQCGAKGGPLGDDDKYFHLLTKARPFDFGFTT